MAHRNCTARSRQNIDRLSTKAKVRYQTQLPAKAPVKLPTPNVPAKKYGEDPVLSYPTGYGYYGYYGYGKGTRRSLNQRQKRKLKRQR